MKIYFATDHAGFEMKNKLLEFVKELGFEVEDCGAYEFNPDDDYPEFVKNIENKDIELEKNWNSNLLL